MVGRVSAKAAIVNSDGKFLVLTNSRWDSNPKPAYAPDLPGGSLERGETLEQGLIREVKEEIGIDITNAPRRMLARHGPPIVGYPVVIYIVWANIRDIKLDTEHCMFSWLTLEQMKLLPWRGGRRVLFDEIESYLVDTETVNFVEYTEAISYA